MKVLHTNYHLKLSVVHVNARVRIITNQIYVKLTSSCIREVITEENSDVAELPGFYRNMEYLPGFYRKPQKTDC